jgi:hypothetical protein
VALTAQHILLVREIVAQMPHVTLDELADELDRLGDAGVRTATIRRTLRAEGIVRLMPARQTWDESIGLQAPVAAPKRYGYTTAHRREAGQYSTDLTDAEWQPVADLFERSEGSRGAPALDERRHLVHAGHIGGVGCAPGWQHHRRLASGARTPGDGCGVRGPLRGDLNVFTHADCSVEGMEIKGLSQARTASFCQRVLDGRPPSVMPDVPSLRPTHDVPDAPLPIGAYMAAPVHLQDGSLYGTLCCLSFEPCPDLKERHYRRLKIAARLTARLIDEAAGRLTLLPNGAPGAKLRGD